MTSPRERIQLLKTESDRLKQFLSALPADAWSNPTACEAWEVRDVVAHMIMGGEMFTGNITRGLANDPSPSAGMQPAGSVDMAARQVANAKRAIDIRERLGEQLLTSFGERCDDLDRLLAETGPQDWEKPCFHPAATLSVRTYVDLRIAELIVHEWDIRSKLESSAHLREGCFPAMMDVLSAFIVGYLFNPGSKLENTVRYRFELSGEAPSKQDIVVEGGKAHLQPAGSGSPDVTFRCDTETFVLLAYERITMAEALEGGRIAVEGNQELADEFAG